MPTGPKRTLETTHDLRDERLVVGVLLVAVVTAMAFAQLFLAGRGSSGIGVLPLLQGPAVAVYGAILALCVDPKRGLAPAALFVLLGTTQPAWALGALVLLEGVGVRQSTMPGEWWLALPYVLTGLVLALPAWWAVRRWWGLAGTLTATPTAAVLAGWAPHTLAGIDTTALAAGVLHVGLSWTLGAAVVWRTWRIVPAKASHCPACGYPRVGLVTKVCPECGRAFERR